MKKLTEKQIELFEKFDWIYNCHEDCLEKQEGFQQEQQIFDDEEIEALYEELLKRPKPNKRKKTLKQKEKKNGILVAKEQYDSIVKKTIESYMSTQKDSFSDKDMNNLGFKKACQDIWLMTYKKYMIDNDLSIKLIQIDKVFELCDKAVCDFKKSMEN